MTDPETLAALLRELARTETPNDVFGSALLSAEWLIARGVRVSPERAPPENHVIVKGATSSQQDTYSNALPRSTLIAARLEALVLEYTDSGECQECGTEVCRGAKHDPDCVIGQVDAALRGSP